MNSESSPHTVYLVAIDGTPSGSRVVEVACNLAALAGAALHIVHVVDVTASPAAKLGALALPPETVNTARLVLDRVCTEAQVRFAGTITAHLAVAEPARAIVQIASRVGADLVVVGTAPQSAVERLLLGSVAEKVVRGAGCPVLVVRPKEHHVHDEPTIEPPCPDCVAVQDQTARAQLWCERHATRHPRGHLHYEWPPTFAVGSMNFRPL